MLVELIGKRLLKLSKSTKGLQLDPKRAMLFDTLDTVRPYAPQQCPMPAHVPPSRLRPNALTPHVPSSSPIACPKNALAISDSNAQRLAHVHVHILSLYYA